MLIQSKQYLDETGQDSRNIALYGQDNNGTVWAICKMNMFLHNTTGAHIAYEDTLQSPEFTEGGYIQKFDRVIANPPFSQNYTRATMKYPQRFRYGWAPETGKKADLMFVQHMIASLKENGRMATIMPHGVLFRGGAEKVIRENIVKEDLIEAIIGLPQHLFYGTGIPACVLIINKKKSKDIKGKIFFINADAEYGEGRNQNFLRPEDIEKIVSAVDGKKDISKYSRLVDTAEVEKNEHNLNIRRYVDNSPEPEIEDVKAHFEGGIPKREIELSRPLLKKYKTDADDFFEDVNAEYAEFKGVPDKTDIKGLIETHEGVLTVNRQAIKALDGWWVDVKKKIERLPKNNHVAEFRRVEIETFETALDGIKALDVFQKSGVFVNWWEGVRYDLKTIVSAGWSPSLIPDEYVKKAFFEKELIEIESIEIAISNLEETLADLVENSEENGEEEKGLKSVKSSLKAQINDLKESGGESAKKELSKLKETLDTILKKESKLKETKRTLKEKERELEAKILLKKKSFTEAEARELILSKFYDGIRAELERYLAVECRNIVRVLEGLWDKYKIPLSQISKERDKSAKGMNELIKKLGYF